MNTDPPTVDTATERYEAACLACLRSDELTERAIEWASHHAWRHAALVETIVDYYTESPYFETWIQDVVDGEDVA
jgi:hypothetical protein